MEGKKGCKIPCKFFKQDEKLNYNNQAKINMAGVGKILDHACIYLDHIASVTGCHKVKQGTGLYQSEQSNKWNSLSHCIELHLHYKLT
jgi:hypothetical protein